MTQIKTFSIQIYTNDNILERLKSSCSLKVKDATDENDNILLIDKNICDCDNDDVYLSFVGSKYQIKNNIDCLDGNIYINSYLRNALNVNIDDDILCVFFILSN
jgi:hypothetical protein